MEMKNGNVEQRLENFVSGKEFYLQDILGCHFEEGNYTFRVWAPSAQQVWLVGDFNSWQKTMPMVKDKYGVWSIRSELPQNNQFYKYLVKQNNGEEIMKIDPMATRFEARPGDAAVIGDLRKKRWHDGSWLGRNKRSNWFARPINIYEVHPSSWKTHPDSSPYTLKDLKRELIPYVKKYGFNGVMNYPARNFVVSLLTKDDQIKAEDKFSQLVENYPSAFLKNCLNNIGTHDTERIKTVLHGNENLVAIAFGLLMMLPGVPCIYYGDEAGLIGKKTLIIAASFHGDVRVNF
ncbi:alpha-amylase family glycosyl hydrolase [Lactobacillus intestinalis]|uniref:Glycogen branching enzyme n=2 Tax=Lactobacillus intestinalis TaxID=151781 RepID=A0ABR5PQN6_9LACO|nr:glycogen branching enzyme [Lactobacillus intestinalis DSM 6629]UTW39899.1 hypothetical protein KBW87_05575 [Lactobacillus intestinalis]